MTLKISKTQILTDDIKNIKDSIGSQKQFILFLDKSRRKEEGIFIVHWQEGLKEIYI